MRLSILLLTLAVLAPQPRAAEPNPAETKLRESLRNTLLQLRTLQSERDTLAAEKTKLEQEKQILATKSDALAKQAAEDQDAAAKKTAALQQQNDRQTETVAQLQLALEKWKAAQGQAAALASDREAARAGAAQHAVELQRRVDDQQAKNLALYKVAIEVLDRYEHFGLGTALTAREPFVGTTRVALQNMVQEYHDKMREQRLRPETARPAPAPAGTPVKRANSGYTTPAPCALFTLLSRSGNPPPGGTRYSGGRHELTRAVRRRRPALGGNP